MQYHLITPLHQATTRDYFARMVDNKVDCMKVAKSFGEEYWDGDRRYGYGGYRYIPGRWRQVAEQLISKYKLVAGSKVLDVGCGKGFLLHEMLLVEPGLIVVGYDISTYAVGQAINTVRPYLFVHKAQDEFPYEALEFDLVLSIGVLHNLKIFDLKKSLIEITRVGKQCYILIESYRNELELFNLQCWALTCATFLGFEEWVWILDQFGYTGDYEFIYFE